jgi:hypothetical protein
MKTDKIVKVKFCGVGMFTLLFSSVPSRAQLKKAIRELNSEPESEFRIYVAKLCELVDAGQWDIERIDLIILDQYA